MNGVKTVADFVDGFIDALYPIILSTVNAAIHAHRRGVDKALITRIIVDHMLELPAKIRAL